MPAWKSYTSFITLDALLNGRFDIFVDALRHMVLPIITLSYINWALFLRLMRSSMLESMSQDYITTARSKGVRKRRDQQTRPPECHDPGGHHGWHVHRRSAGRRYHHRNHFQYPGIGQAGAAAASQLDVITVLSFVLLTGVILLFSNLIVDVAYAFLDPRVRLS